LSFFDSRLSWLPRFALTAAIGLVFGTLAALASVPLPWMLGSLFGAALFSMVGVKLGMPSPLKLAARMCIGLILGASIDADTFSRAIQWPASIAILSIGMIAAIAVTALYYVKIAKFDRLTAVAASLTGGLSNVVTVAIQMGANAPGAVLGQLLRLTTVVVLVPTLYMAWLGEPEAVAFSSNGIDWFGTNLWIVPLALPAYWLARLVRLPVAEFLGPLILAAILGIFGFNLGMPEWFFATVFIVLGTTIGARFYQLSVKLLMGIGGHAVIATILVVGGSALLAWPISAVTGVPIHVALLAIIPGGIAEMAILAVVLGVDPVFVTFHQAFRSIVLNATAPFVLTWFKPRSSAGSQSKSGDKAD
jgi:uncharacterized protein